MKEVIFLVEEAEDGGYTARALGYPVFTEADNIEQLREKTKDAVKCHFDESEMPKIIRLHMVKDEVIPV